MITIKLTSGPPLVFDCDDARIIPNGLMVLLENGRWHRAYALKLVQLVRLDDRTILRGEDYRMAKCVQCGAETDLYVEDAPLCIVCSDRRDEEVKKKIAERQEQTIERAKNKSA